MPQKVQIENFKSFLLGLGEADFAKNGVFEILGGLRSIEKATRAARPAPRADRKNADLLDPPPRAPRLIEKSTRSA